MSVFSRELVTQPLPKVTGDARELNSVITPVEIRNKPMPNTSQKRLNQIFLLFEYVPMFLT
jgi:hypothetical protein